MSLFDLDDSFISDTSDNSNHSNPISSATAEPLKYDVSKQNSADLKPTQAYGGGNTAAKSHARRGEFTLTESEVLNAQQDQRRLLELRFASRECLRGNLCSGRPLDDHTSSSVGLISPCEADTKDSSIFGNSIAEALRLRKQDREELMIRKLRAERSSDPELVQKDLEVGVFMTSAYKQMLSRHEKPGNLASAPGHKHTNAHQSGRSEEDDPLESYIRELEEKERNVVNKCKDDPTRKLIGSAMNEPNSHTKGKDVRGLGTHYDQAMLTHFYEDTLRAQGLQNVPQIEQAEDNISSPSLGELEALVLGGASDHSEADTVKNQKEGLSSNTISASDLASNERSNQHTVPPKALKAQNEALFEHRRSLFLAREARQRCRADGAFINESVRRCQERMFRSIKMK